MQSTKRIIDCDVHQTYSSQTQLYPYLEEPYLSRVKERGLGYPLQVFTTSARYKRIDATPANGVGGSDYPMLREQLLDKLDISYATLTGEGIIGTSQIPDRDYPVALARAFNNWLLDTWMTYDERFLGCMHVALQDPEAAAKEIYRVGGHPRIVQVMLPALTAMPLAHPYYRPVLRAIADMDLTLGLHFMQPSVTTPHVTPVGMPSTYFEWHTLVSMPYMSQLVMLVTSGVFEEIPNLKVVMLEGGFAWLIHLLWRFDKEYKGLHREAPLMKKLPSEYVKAHFKFGIQPVYEPAEAAHLNELIEMGGLHHTLVFASDYPHWDADEPEFAMRHIKPEWQDAILFGNIASWYKCFKTSK